MKRKKKFGPLAGAVFILGLCWGMAETAQAGESIFAWTYTTDLQPQGHWEVEHWSTLRTGKEHGTYTAVDSREELEYGISDNFQVSLYLNHQYAYAKNFMPAEDPANPGHRLPGKFETAGEDVDRGHDPSKPFRSYHMESISTEFIWRLLSPYTKPIGLALYLEPEFGGDENEIEAKVLLQKNWLEDRLVWALNFNYAVEYEEVADATFARDGMLEGFTGLSYRFAPGWSAAAELWNHHEYADARVHEHSAFFAGPTLHYASKRWWATLGWLGQLPVGSAYSADNQEFAYHNGYILGEEHEKNYVRVKVGVIF